MSRAFDHEPKRLNEVLLPLELGGVQGVKKVVFDTVPQVSQKKPLTHEELLAELEEIRKAGPPKRAEENKTLPEAVIPIEGLIPRLRKLTPEEIQQREEDAHPENLTPERLKAWMERKEKEYQDRLAHSNLQADRKAHREWRRDQIRRGVKFP